MLGSNDTYEDSKELVSTCIGCGRGCADLAVPHLGTGGPGAGWTAGYAYSATRDSGKNAFQPEDDAHRPFRQWGLDRKRRVHEFDV